MKVLALLGPQGKRIQEQSTPLLCGDDRLGLEYEWEKTRAARELDGSNPLHLDFRNYFTAHNDGSLRQDGCEYVFRGPLSGTKAINAINTMDEMQRRMGFEGSYRTSLHVHLDMQDTNFPKDVALFGAVYCLVEPLIYKFVGNNRDACNYCIPWYAHPQHFEQYFSTVKRYTGAGLSPEHVAEGFKVAKQYKYSGLNFFSLGDFGTVEFRQAPVTMQKDKIIQWVNLIIRLKKFAVFHQNMEPEDLIEFASKMGPERFYREVFAQDSPHIVRFSKDIHADLKQGMQTLFQYVAVAS